MNKLSSLSWKKGQIVTHTIHGASFSREHLHSVFQHAQSKSCFLHTCRTGGVFLLVLPNSILTYYSIWSRQYFSKLGHKIFCNTNQEGTKSLFRDNFRPIALAPGDFKILCSHSSPRQTLKKYISFAYHGMSLCPAKEDILRITIPQQYIAGKRKWKWECHHNHNCQCHCHLFPKCLQGQFSTPQAKWESKIPVSNG